MPDLKLLQADLAQTLAARDELVEKHNGKLPDDARAEDANLHERAMKLRVLIDEENQKLRDKDFEDIQKFATEPRYQVPRAVNDDDDSRKLMGKAGWEFKDGKVIRETTLGPVEMYSEEVLFGALPIAAKDQDVASYFKQARSIMQPEYRAAYLKYIGMSSRVENAMAQLSPAEQKALSEGTDSAGGYLVPPDIQAEMLVRLPQRSVFERLARVVNTSRDKVVYPRVVSASATASGVASGGGSIFSSGFIGSWAGETPAFSSTDPGFGTFEIGIKKARVASQLSNDFIADAVVNIAAWLAVNGTDNLALVEEQGFVAGDGTALKPLGIINGGSATVDVEGTTSNSITNTTGGTGSAPKLIDLVYALPSQYAQNAVLLMQRGTEGKIRKLVDGQGRYLWPLQSGSMFGAPNGIGTRTLLEYPVYNSEFCPADGTDTNKVIIFGDISNYIIARRTAFSTQVLRERFADTDQTGIIITDRVGGALWNDDAVRFGVV